MAECRVHTEGTYWTKSVRYPTYATFLASCTCPKETDNENMYGLIEIVSEATGKPLYRMVCKQCNYGTSFYSTSEKAAETIEYHKRTKEHREA